MKILKSFLFFVISFYCFENLAMNSGPGAAPAPARSEVEKKMSDEQRRAINKKLFTAIIVQNELDIVQCINRGADVNVKNQDVGLEFKGMPRTGVTPLIMAISGIKPSKEIIEHLLQTKAQPNDQSACSHALALASRMDDRDVIKMLLAAKADVNALAKQGTALLNASSVETARLLLDHKADVNIGKLTALDVRLNIQRDTRNDERVAINKNYLQLLLDRKANISTTSYDRARLTNIPEYRQQHVELLDLTRQKRYQQAVRVQKLFQLACFQKLKENFAAMKSQMPKEVLNCIALYCGKSVEYPLEKELGRPIIPHLIPLPDSDDEADESDNH